MQPVKSAITYPIQVEEEAHLFLDTNVLLHYDALDGVKWRTLVNANRVVLHVAQSVMDEISLKKDMGETKKLRKRADTIAKRLLQCLEKENPFRLREGEILLLEPDSPRLEEFPGLNSASRDDQLIASALTFQKTHQKKCYVVTGDSSLTLRVKLRRSELQHLSAPNSSRLPEEPDADERQRNTLQKELLELKRAQPELKLTFMDGETVMRVEQGSVDEKALIQAKMKNVRSKMPHLPKPAPPPLGSVHLTGSPAEIDAYNKALDEFYRKYEVWLGEALAIKRRAVDVNLKTINGGTVPAESILVTLHFPDGFKLIEAEDLSDEFPKLPKRPKRPGFDPELLRAGLQTPRTFFPSALTSQPTKGISIKKTNSYHVEWEHEKLRQDTFEPLHELIALFESEPQSFEITYEIRADNLRAVAQGSLHVVVPEGI